VARAAAFLRQFDRAPAHVFLEALVLEMSTSLLAELGTDLQKAGFGELADLATGVGTGGAPTVAFRYLHRTHNTTTLTALVNLLVSTERARVVSRPFAATMSAQPAKIEITEERYVITEQTTGGSTVTGSQPVQAGISIGLTPVVARDERIRLAVKVEDSEFTNAAIPNVSVAKVKSAAETTVHVASGQSVVIGGLTVSRRSESLAGLPWLRHIPGLSLVAAKQGESDNKMEVLVIVTPYVWLPGTQLPVPLPDAFRPREERQRPRFFEEELPHWPVP
jgi:type II secretory pathway component GspD/PulD (secretin)